MQDTANEYSAEQQSQSTMSFKNSMDHLINTEKTPKDSSNASFSLNNV